MKGFCLNATQATSHERSTPGGVLTSKKKVLPSKKRFSSSMNNKPRQA